MIAEQEKHREFEKRRHGRPVCHCVQATEETERIEPTNRLGEEHAVQAVLRLIPTGQPEATSPDLGQGQSESCGHRNHEERGDSE